MSTINTLLPKLLGNALIEPSGPDYPLERKVVAELRKRLRTSQAVGLVGFAYDVEDAAGTAKALVTEVGEAHMSSFNAGDNLSRRFAAAAVMDLMQGYNGPASTAAALAARAAAITELSPVVADLGPVAVAALSRLADAMRTVSFESLGVQPFPPGKSGELPAEDATAVTSSVLRTVVQEQRGAVRNAAVNTEKRLGRLELLTRRNSEEIDLLWWALDPFSDYVDEWSQAGHSATLAAALEVRRRLLIDPPPRGTRRVLAEALTKAGVDPRQQQSLHTVIAAAPEQMLSDSLLTGSDASWATPVLSSIRQRPNSGDAVGGGVTASLLDWASQLVADLSLERVTT